MFDDEDITFDVVANHEEQYSIWPEFKDIPAGWIAVGPSGSKEECLEYIERVWTDMRPKSLRDAMHERREEGASESDGQPDETLRSRVDDIVSSHDDRVDEYANGRPELYGWFFARVFEALEQENETPDNPAAIRAALNEALPPHDIPEEYA